MNTLTFEISGKLVLSGEWNVLIPGHSCITLPTRGITITIEPSYESCITSPTQNLQRRLITTLQHDNSPIAQFLIVILGQVAAILATYNITPIPFHLTLENNPHTYVAHEGKLLKIGVGSSAGIAVGLIKAVTQFHGIWLDVQELFMQAFTAHHRAAGGVGSGSDVATAVVGKVNLYTTGSAKNIISQQTPISVIPASEPGSRISKAQDPGSEAGITKITSASGITIIPLAIPSTWHLAVGFSGASASTPQLIKVFNAAREKDATTINTILNEIEALVHQLAQIPPVQEAMILINKNQILLSQLSQECDNALETHRLTQMIALAQSCGAAAKFSGAGGGDCVVALCDSAQMRHQVYHTWQTAGFFSLDSILTIDASTTK